MGLLTYLLERMVGKLRFYIYIGDRAAAEVIVNEEKEIIIDIKNPVLAIQAGIDTFITKKGFDSENLKKIKKMGYKIKVKYKGFVFDL